jgi:hypothetical protein
MTNTQTDRLARIDRMLTKRPDPIVEVAPRVREMVYRTHPLPLISDRRTRQLTLNSITGSVELRGAKLRSMMRFR